MPFSTMGIQKNKLVTLQVRILLKNKKTDYFLFGRGRKVFPFVSASMTLEASLVLTLFLFAAVSLILPMKILTTERRVQAGLEAVGEDFSRYGYLQDALERGSYDTVLGADEFAKGFCRNLGAGVAAGYAQACAMAHLDTGQAGHVTMLRSKILEDGELFDLVLDYEITMPFPVLGLGTVSRTARSTRRAWIGKAGKDDGNGEGGEADEDEIVYVGKNSTRYHQNRNCHYLANVLTAVAYDFVGEQRNQDGGKYYACAVCGKSAGPGNTVYIMPSGSSFHGRTDCEAIVAYARAVRLKEVRHLGACSYCSR